MIFQQEHYELLAPAVRSRQDISVLAERAEAAVVDAYTEVQCDGTVVKLKGWHDDPAQMDEGLRRRLLLTIAMVIDHMATMPAPHIQSATRGERTVTYRAVPSLPRGWSRLLGRYDLRDPLYRV